VSVVTASLDHRLHRDEVHVWVRPSGWHVDGVLSRYIDGPIPLHRTKRGKPYVSAETDLRFGVSHSRGLTVVAVTRGRDVGVDVERIRPIPRLERVAERTLGSVVADDLMHVPAHSRAEAFLRRWTRLEAKTKLSGSGLPGTAFCRAPRSDRTSDHLPDPPSTEGAVCFDLDLPSPWIGALALDTPAEDVVIRTKWERSATADRGIA